MSAAYPYAVGAGRWTDYETYLDRESREWLTQAGGVTRFKVSRNSISDHYEEIEHQYIRHPFVRGHPKVRVFAVERHRQDQSRLSLSEFAENYHASALSETVPPDKSTLSRREIGMLSNLDGKSFVRHWERVESRIRQDGSPALRRTERTPGASKGRKQPEEFLRKDVEAILRGDESSHPRVGRPGRKRPGTLDLVQAKKLLKGFLEDDGPRLKKDVRAFASKNFISRRQLQKALAALKVSHTMVGGGRNGTCYCCLPGQEPSAEARLERSPRLKKIIEFLRDALADGQPHSRLEVVKAAARDGISECDLCRALPYLDIAKERGTVGKGRPGTWRLRSVPKRKEQTVLDSTRAAPPPPRVREYDRRTAELYEFCYKHLRARVHKRSHICELARRNFSEYELVESDVTNYARRHAKRTGEPWPV